MTLEFGLPLSRGEGIRFGNPAFVIGKEDALAFGKGGLL